VYIGSVNEYRRLDTVVEALSSLASRIEKPVQFDVFGAADETYIESLVPTGGNENFNFEWHGFIDHEEIPRLAGQADVAVSPLSDVTSFEVSSPAKIYEYLAMGLPIVATRITPHERILTDEQDAILVPPGETDAFTDAFQKLAGNRELLAEYSAAARKKGQQNSWDSRIESTIEIVESARKPEHSAMD
jgi:glycosyltransferase involved in cell wall biosynthesis